MSRGALLRAKQRSLSAATLQDLRILARPELYGWAGSKFVTSAAAVTLRQWIEDNTAGIRATEAMPAPDTTDGATADLLIRRGARPGAYSWPTWQMLYIGMDPYTSMGVGTKVIGWTVGNFAPATATEGRDDWLRLGVRYRDGTG